jgi:flagellar basal body-associated protein FliL
MSLSRIHKILLVFLSIVLLSMLALSGILAYRLLQKPDNHSLASSAPTVATIPPPAVFPMAAEYVSMQNITTNIPSANSSESFIQITPVLALSKKSSNLIMKFEPQILHLFNMVIVQYNKEQLLTVQYKERLAQDMADAANAALPEPIVEKILFKQIIIN